MTNIIPTGDNGKIIETDYVASEYGELLLQIYLMPKQNNIIKHHSQYSEKDFYNFCTGFSGINAFATINDYDFTLQDKKEILALAKTRGYTGAAWSRSEGWITVMKRWNNKFPDNKAMIFTVMLFSPEFNAYIDKFGIVGTSILVDGEYRRDVRDNLRLDGSGPWQKVTGHATCTMKDNEFICIDSVPQNYSNLINTPMIYKLGEKQKIDLLYNYKNLRKDCHIIIMEKWLKNISIEERARLEEYKLKLEQSIKLNSEMYHLTHPDDEKEREMLRAQNNHNRGKLALVNAKLS